MDDDAAPEDAAPGPVQLFPDDSRVAVLAAYTDHLEDLVAVYRDALAGDGEALDRAPAPGAWTVAQVLHHLADYELAHALAVRRVIVEDSPRLPSWDQDGYAARLGYEVRPPDDALTTVLALRQLDSRLLAALPPPAWLRAGVRDDGTRVALAELVSAASAHLADHVLQARRALIGMI